jgi:DNA-binding XRE family transcriptional regulator
MKKATTIPSGYWAVLYPLRGHEIGVRFTEHPTINTFGRNRVHAIEMAEEALNGALESELDRNLVLPSTHRPKVARGEEAVFVHLAPEVRTAYLVRAWRNEAGLSQSEMAKRLGVSCQAYQRMERPGRANLTVAMLDKIAAAVGKSLVLSAEPRMG